SGPAVFKLGRTDIIVIGFVCVGIGVALGFLLPTLGSLAARFPIPFGDPIEKLSRFDQPWVVAIRPLIGAVPRLTAAAVTAGSTPPVLVSAAALVIADHHDHPLRISRASSSTAYFADGQLTLLTEGGHQAYRRAVQRRKDAVAVAFTSRA